MTANHFKIIMLLLVAAATFCQAGSLRDLPIDKMLEEAYFDHSVEKLQKVMMAVTQAQESITKEQLARKPEFEQQVYALFSEFYKEENILKFWKEIFAGNADRAIKMVHPFIALPSTTTVMLVDDDNLPMLGFPALSDEEIQRKIIGKYQILDFRPYVGFTNKKYYVTTNVEFRLKLFLMRAQEQHLPEEASKRLEFLNQLITAGPIGMFRTLSFVSQPLIDQFEMNRAMNLAVIHFRISDRGGYYKFKRENGQWKPMEWKLTHCWD